MKVLLTGGAGYIGSTTATALEQAGHTPVVLDSLVRGPRAFVGDRLFYEGDVGDTVLLRKVLSDHPDIDAVVHMAALIEVPESVREPARYYRENVAASLELAAALAEADPSPRRLLFSSSASVYAPADGFEVFEDSPLAPASPYARTKQMMEDVLADVAAASDLRVVNLRYFNPIGAAPDLSSGMHVRTPSHVLGQLVLAAQGHIDAFRLTGTDLPTRDGSGLRDFVHVWDLARAHVRALERFDTLTDTAPSTVLNLGTGRGTTVRELVAAFEDVTGLTVPLVETDPRPGDVVGAFANVDRAADLLDWRAELSVEDGIESAMAWARRRHEVLGYA